MGMTAENKADDAQRERIRLLAEQILFTRDLVRRDQVREELRAEITRLRALANRTRRES